MSKLFLTFFLIALVLVAAKPSRELFEENVHENLAADDSVDTEEVDEEDSIAELAPNYKDVGPGSCILQNGANPKYTSLTKGIYEAIDCQNQCGANCMGYSFTSAGGFKNCRIFLQGPLLPTKRSRQWSDAKCIIKVAAHPNTGIYADDYKPPAVFKNIGFGSCVLQNGVVPKTQKTGDNFNNYDCEDMCEENAACTGFAWSNNGGFRACHFYFQGPLLPTVKQSQRFGTSNCNIKISAHPNTGIYASDYKPPAVFRKIGFGSCVLQNGVVPKTQKTGESWRDFDCMEACQDNPACTGFAWSNNGGWRACHLYTQGPLLPTVKESKRFGTSDCNIKVAVHPTTGIYAPGYTPPAKYTNAGSGSCVLENKQVPKHREIASGIRSFDCMETCDDDANCKGYAYSDNGGWRFCRIFSGVAALSTSSITRWTSASTCYVKN